MPVGCVKLQTLREKKGAGRVRRGRGRGECKEREGGRREGGWRKGGGRKRGGRERGRVRREGERERENDTMYLFNYHNIIIIFRQ